MSKQSKNYFTFLCNPIFWLFFLWCVHRTSTKHTGTPYQGTYMERSWPWTHLQVTFPDSKGWKLETTQVTMGSKGWISKGWWENPWCCTRRFFFRLAKNQNSKFDAVFMYYFALISEWIWRWNGFPDYILVQKWLQHFVLAVFVCSHW